MLSVMEENQASICYDIRKLDTCLITRIDVKKMGLLLLDRNLFLRRN